MSLDFDLTSEQQMIRKMVRNFAEKEIAPVAQELDDKETFSPTLTKRMGELGLFGPFVPEEYGGSNVGYISYIIATEEIARIDGSQAATLAAGNSLGISPIYYYGSEEQKRTWLPDLCAGRRLGGFGLTEPDAGSDAGGTRTSATLDEASHQWVIDGEKAFITNSGTPITSVVTITARTAPAEISAIIVPAGTPGFTVMPPYRKMGWHASDTHGLSFSSCRVPEDNLLGERGRGFAQFLAILDDGRVAIAALAVGVVQACLEHTVAYAQSRNAFGKPIGSNQGVAFPCADLAVMADAARMLTYKAAWLKDHERPFKRAAAIAKLYATEAAVTATRMATQVFGGYGFIDDTPVSRFYRDAKILEIGEGTSEIQRLVIARDLGLPVD